MGEILRARLKLVKGLSDGPPLFTMAARRFIFRHCLDPVVALRVNLEGGGLYDVVAAAKSEAALRRKIDRYGIECSAVLDLRCLPDPG
mgnify:CR=1 FL=1